MWEVEFFDKDNGRCPTSEFILDTFNEEQQNYVYNCIKQLQENGNRLTRPQAGILGDGIYELRPTINGVEYRFLYFFDRSIIWITHGFKKNTKKVPPSEIKIAKEYRKIQLKRKERMR